MSASSSIPLFPDCLDLDVRVGGRRGCGRGATPRREREVQLDQPNLTGRRKLIFKYRPLKAWQSWQIKTDDDGQPTIEISDQLDLVERGIIYYFTKIGGFYKADDEIVRLFYQALDHLADEARELEVTPVTLMKWIIDAKERSLQGDCPEETAEKRAFIPHPDNFLKPKKLNTWLDKSDECVKRRAQLRARQHDRQRSNLRDRLSQIGLGQPSQPIDEGKAIEGEQQLLDWFYRLPAQRQRRAILHVKPDWQQQVANAGEDPQSKVWQDLLRIRAAHWAQDAWPNGGDGEHRPPAGDEKATRQPGNQAVR